MLDWYGPVSSTPKPSTAPREKTWRPPFAGILVGMTVLLVGAGNAVADAPLQPRAALTVATGLSLPDKEATNLSGAACYTVENKRRSCLLIGDEVRYARFFSFDDKRLTPQEQLFLLPNKDSAGKKLKETDAEGVSFDGNYYYLIGSHGLNKEGKRQDSRYFAYRVAIDPVTGKVADFGSASAPSSAVVRSTKIGDAIASQNFLSQASKQVPGQQGVNIEGLAVVAGQMFVGFRGPIINHQAIILKVPVASVFEAAAMTVTSFTVALEDDQGIRDLAAVADGLLILSGPQERKPGPVRVYLWKPGAEKPKKLAELAGYGDQANPEAILVSAETDTAYTVLVLADGPDSGDPKIYDVMK